MAVFKQQGGVAYSDIGCIFRVYTYDSSRNT